MIFCKMSHVRVEEIHEAYHIPWIDIIIACAIVTLVVLKLKS